MPKPPEVNKFAQMMANARNLEPLEEKTEQTQQTAADHPPENRKERGRPATGKRSNNEYASTTVFLKKKTKKAAAQILLNRDDLDLSELLEKLLTDWISKNS